MKANIVTEGSAKIAAYEGKISRKLTVFYNPVMRFNRDISVVLLRALGRKNMKVADPLAASGVRAIRFLRETNGIVASVAVNDFDKKAVADAKSNAKLNKIVKSKISFSQKDASQFLLSSKGFDYIDIDPFGTPVPFLDAAVRKINNEGILAVTATDTAVLAGTYPEVCRRRYWAEPMRNELMHEVALRILIRKVQLIGIQYDVALIPLFSYSKDHYYRAFLTAFHEKEKCAEILKMNKYLNYCRACIGQTVSGFADGECSLCNAETKSSGPLWAGKLFDKKITKKMKANADDMPAAANDFLSAAYEEADAAPGFFELHEFASHARKSIPKTSDALEMLRKKGFSATRTHFSAHGIKTDANAKEFSRLIFGRR